MRKLMVVFGCAVFGIAGAAWAQGQQVREALDLVRDALERVEDEGGRCRKAIFRDLEDLKGDLRALKDGAGEKALRRAARNARDAARDAREACGKRVVRLLEDAREELERALEVRDMPEPPPPPPCWEAGDPGCGRTRGGLLPMERPAFDSLLGMVRGQKPHVFQMLETFKTGLGGQRLTCRQLGRLVQEFKPHVFQMLDAVKAAAPNLVDPQHAGEVTPHFQPHTFQMQDAAQIIGAQRAD
jgi:hypothetical protein